MMRDSGQCKFSDDPGQRYSSRQGYSSKSARTRRSFILMLASASLAACVPTDEQNIEEGVSMYGLIGKIIAVDGKRDELSSILLEGLRDMPGNISYVVANDPQDTNALWITEIWVDSKSHQESLALESVQNAIKKGRPLIAGMEQIAETQPIGGYGI